MKVRLRYDNYQTPFVCLVCMWLLCILIFVWCGWCMGVLNLLFASTSAGANRSYCGSSYTSIMVWLMYVLCTYMFGVCVCVCDVLESFSWCPWVTLLYVYMFVLQYISTTPLCLMCAWLWCVFDGWLVCGCGMCVWGESTQALFCPFTCFWLCLWSKGWRDQK